MSAWPPPSGPDSSLEPLAPSHPAPRDLRLARFWRWGTVLLIVALVAVPIANALVPREIALWHAAAALESRLKGDSQQAWQELDRAQAWDPRNATIWLQRAAWLREEARYAEALECCEQAVRLAPWNHEAYVERSEVHHKLRQHAQAVDDWKKVVTLNEQKPLIPDIGVWNGLAYSRALAGMELEAGLEDIDRAVRRKPNSPEILDTRGYLYFQLTKYAEALADLDTAVRIADERLVANDKLLTEPRSPIIDRRSALQQRKLAVTNLAVILYHRSLVLDKLKKDAAAAADRDRIRQLGFDPFEELF